MTFRIARVCFLSIGLVALIAGCGSSPSDGSGVGGSSASAGTTGAGGIAAAGTSGAADGSTGRAGSVGSGGASSTGGVTGAGGNSAGGGGLSGSGAKPGSGGSTATAGTSGAGGSTATGGTIGTGAAGTKGEAGSTGAGGATPTGGTNGKAGTGGATHTGAWKVMMLGDSVTESFCYPQITYETLMAGNHKNFELVGSEISNHPCGGGAPASVKDEGHAGYGVTYLVQNNTRSTCTKSSGCGSYAELQTWAAEKPEIVLMHFGTNDVWDGIGTTQILAAYVAVIAEFRKQNPSVIFFVSKIIKLDPSGCTSCLSNVAALAAAVTPTWASTNSTPTSPIYIIDHYDSSFDPTNTADSSDGVHPSTIAGATIMATITYNAIVASGYF